jgi:ankyrin repeat protein
MGIAQQDEKFALKNAVLKGSAELVKILLDSEFDLNRRQKLVTKHADNENSIWWHAINHMQSDVVKIMLDSVYEPVQKQALLQMIDGNGKAALQIAANTGNAEMARNLLQAAVDPQAIIFQTDGVGMNAFMLAALDHHTALALIIFDMTINKYELLKLCSKYQVQTIDLVSRKLSKELISRLTQIVKDHPREDLKNLIQDLKKSQIKNLYSEKQQTVKID